MLTTRPSMRTFVRPDDRIAACQRAAAEVLYLLIQAFCPFADLIPGEAFESQIAGQLLHLSGGHALYERLLNDLNQCRLAAFASRHEKRDVSTVVQLWYHEVSHAGVQPPGAVTTAKSLRDELCTFFSAGSVNSFVLFPI